MRRWLKENSLSAGDGTPLHDIAAIEDLQRALKAFSGEDLEPNSTPRSHSIQFLLRRRMLVSDIIYPFLIFIHFILFFI
jgi:hypothetical protein